MNKKGFTLVELMAVIAIIIFIGIIVVPGVLDIIKENREKGYSEIERRLEEAAAKYMANEYVDSNVDSIIVTKEQLIETGYIKEVYDLKNNSICDAYVVVKNLSGIAKFNVVLNCDSYVTDPSLVKLNIDLNGGTSSSNKSGKYKAGQIIE